MKKIFITISLLIAGLSLSAQNKAVDKLFEKYTNRDGYTSVVITKHMFNLFSNVETQEDDEYMNMIKNLNNIRILSGPDGGEDGVNFYNEINDQTLGKDYQELMVIHESNTDIKFLVKEAKGLIVELLMVVGGKTDNVLISITGNIDMKTIAKLSKGMGIEGLDKLNDLNEDRKK